MTSPLEDQLCRLSRSLVEVTAAAGCGVTLLTESGQSLTIHVSHPLITKVEDLQHTLGEGPGVAAARSGAAVLVSDLCDVGVGNLGRWPTFAKEIVAMGLVAAFAYPLRVGTASVGALTLYRDHPGALSSDQASAARLTADAVAVAVARDGLGTLDPEGDPMQVHQAAGMVTVQLGVSIDEALLRIRSSAYAEGTTADQLADDIVSRRRRLSKDEE